METRKVAQGTKGTARHKAEGGKPGIARQRNASKAAQGRGRQALHRKAEGGKHGIARQTKASKAAQGRGRHAR